MVKIITNLKYQTNLKLIKLVYAGILGTLAFNAVMYADIAITGIPLDIAAVLGNLVVGDSEYSQTIGHTIHFANGIGLSILFGYVILPVSKRIKKLPVIVYAIIFGILELIIAVWFGMLPMLGAGVAGLDIDLMVPFMTLARHIAYGAVIGFVLRNNVK